MTCSDCHSPDLRKVSLIYESGLTISNSRSVGGGIGVGTGLGVGVGVGGGRSRGKHVTALAARLAPPEHEGVAGLILVTIIVVFVALGFHLYWAFAIAGLTAYFAFLGIRHNLKVYPVLHARWAASFMCQRCGWIGVPAAPLPVTLGDMLPASAPPRLGP